jgi:hypothetical protein
MHPQQTRIQFQLADFSSVIIITNFKGRFHNGFEGLGSRQQVACILTAAISRFYRTENYRRSDVM